MTSIAVAMTRILAITLAISPLIAVAGNPPAIRTISAEGDSARAQPSADTVDPITTQSAPLPAAASCAWPLDCRPVATPQRLNIDAYSAEIVATSFAYGVDPDFVRAIIHAESAFNPKARSPKGAQGLMQLMPATAARFGVQDPWDPGQNIQGGVQYLAWLTDRFAGDESLVAAAYNAGEGAVDRYSGIPPYAETTAYVDRVTQLANAYRHAAMTRMLPTGQPALADSR
jgi:soluble lytic murein transglycosylase-like protein